MRRFPLEFSFLEKDCAWMETWVEHVAMGIFWMGSGMCFISGIFGFQGYNCKVISERSGMSKSSSIGCGSYSSRNKASMTDLHPQLHPEAIT